MPERLKSVEIAETNPGRGLILRRVDTQGAPVGDPLLVTNCFVSGFRGDPNSIKYLNVVPLTSQEGVLSYKPLPQRILKGEKVIVVGDLRTLGWEFTEKFYKPLNEDERRAKEKQIYFLPELSENELKLLG